MKLKDRVLDRFRPRRPPRKALFVWELGAGFTHLQNIFGVARYLRSLDVECVIAVADTRHDELFRSIGCKSLQSYLWPVMRYDMALPKQRKATVYTDILANFGLCEKNNCSAMLSHYGTLFDLVQPDILLCENAPGAALAASGRIPKILFGSTLMMLPPTLGTSFVPIDAASAEPSWPLDEVLDAINAALGEHALPQLTTVSELLDCAALMPFGPAAFDPYFAHRTQLILSPHCPNLPKKIIAEKADTAFVYLHKDVQDFPPVMKSLLALPKGSRIYVQSLSDEWAQKFSQAGMRVETDMIALEDIARHGKFLLHHGGVTLTAAALAMGIPQIILARSKENELAGRYLVENNFGHLHAMTKATYAELIDSCGGLLNSNEMETNCRLSSDFHRTWFKDDPTYHVAVEASKILGIKMPAPSSIRESTT